MRSASYLLFWLALGGTSLGACSSPGGSTATAPADSTRKARPAGSTTMGGGMGAGATNNTVLPTGASGSTNAASGSGAMAPTGSSQ